MYENPNDTSFHIKLLDYWIVKWCYVGCQNSKALVDYIKMVYPVLKAPTQSRVWGRKFLDNLTLV